MIRPDELVDARDRPTRFGLAGFVLLAVALVPGCELAMGRRPVPSLPEVRPVSADAAPQERDGNATSRGPAVPPAPQEAPIDLETALALAGVENPTIALAQQEIQAGLARQTIARALLLPTLSAGGSANVHRGNLLSTRGVIRNVDRQSAYVGAGAGPVGAGTVPYPGVRLTAQLADAVFEPRVARERVAVLQAESQAVRNQVLLDVVEAYLSLAAAEAGLLAYQQSDTEYAEVARLTASHARAGQGREGDANRARGDYLLIQAQTQRAEEGVAVAAAQLSRLLHADPSLRFRVPGGLIPEIELFDPNADLEALVQEAVRNRPEVAAAGAAIRVRQTQLRQERVRPFVPFVSLGYSAGGFGGGSNLADTTFGHFNDRTDIDAVAFWTLRNMGLGNVGIQRVRRSQVYQARAGQAIVVNDVRREVASARALLVARAREVEVARRRYKTALQGYDLDLGRIRNLQGRPIEVLNSATLLNQARQDVIRTRVGYVAAQFQLWVALGSPPDLPLLSNATVTNASRTAP